MTSKRDKILERITSTVKIEPNEHSPVTSTNRLNSLSYAIAGCLYMLRHQKNTRIQAVATVMVVGLAFWLQLDRFSWAILILTTVVVWMAEFINAAVEAAVNLASPEIHPMAQVGKDVAAAAVLLGVAASVLIGLLLLGPPLVDKIGY